MRPEAPVAERAIDGRAALPARTVRRLRAADVPAAAGILGTAFRGNRFYAAALGFDDACFARYWEAFVDLAIADPAGLAFGIESGGRLAGVLLCGTDRFPGPGRGARFLWRVLHGVGWRRWLGYLRFVVGYERLMHRPAAERRLEVRGLWLAVRRDVREPGVGGALVRSALETIRDIGKPLVTGFVDAGNCPLLAFYRRLGFSTLRRVPFAGFEVAVVERRLGPAPGAAPCGG